MPFNVTALQQMQSAFQDAGDATFTGVKRGNLGEYPVEYRPEDQVRVNKKFAATLLSEITGGVSGNDPEKFRQIKAEIEKNPFFKSDIDHPLSGRELAKVVGDCIELIRQAYDPKAHILVPDDKELETEVLKQMSSSHGLERPLTEDEKRELSVSGLRAQIEDLNHQIDLGGLWNQQARDKAQKLQKDFAYTKVKCLNCLENLRLPAEFKRFFRRDILSDRFLRLGQDGVNQYKEMLAEMKEVKVENLISVLDEPNPATKDITDKLLDLAGSLNDQYTSAMKAISSKASGDLCRTTMCRMILANGNRFREALGRMTPDKQVEVLNDLASRISGNVDQKTQDKANLAAELLNIADDMALLPKQIKQEPYNVWLENHRATALDCSEVQGSIGTDGWLYQLFNYSKNKFGQGPSCEYFQAAQPYQGIPQEDRLYYVAPAAKENDPVDPEQDMLHTYTVNSLNVNKALWSSDYSRESVVGEEIIVDDVVQAQTIDHFLNAHRTKAPLRVFAGIRGEFLNSNFYTDKEGKLKFHCKAFQSTSRSFNTGVGFSKSNFEIKVNSFPVIVFDVPPNYPVVALGDISQYGDNEQELLLNQGSSGTVYDIQQNPEYDFNGEKRTVTFYFVRLDAR